MTTFESKIFRAIKKDDLDPLVEMVAEISFMPDGLNFFDDKGNTPLTFATMLLNVDIVDTLLQFGASPEARSKNGETAIDILSKYIDEKKAEIPGPNDPPSMDGVDLPIKVELILDLLLAKIQSEAELKKALRLCVENYFPHLSEKLLKLGVDPTKVTGKIRMPSQILVEQKENRLRKKLKQMGYSLKKSRKKNPQMPSFFGGYMILDLDTNCVVKGASPESFSLCLDDVEFFARN